MKIKETIGIDVSKKTIDVFIYSVKRHKVFKNNVAGFSSMQKWVTENSSFEQSEQLYALEHTGLYSLPLSVYLSEQKLYFVMVPGLELKKSLGLVRGKDDKLDASFIALYAYRKREELTPCELPSKILLELRRLLSLRDKLVKQRSGFKSTLTEMKAMLFVFQLHQ